MNRKRQAGILQVVRFAPRRSKARKDLRTMPTFGVSEAKSGDLHERMQRLGVREEDLVEKFIRGSGRGGQKINKTSSCVYIRHMPSGIEVKCQRERSQTLNRFLARRELCERLAERVQGAQSLRQQAAARILRQKRRRSRRQRQKLLDMKHRHSQQKGLRRSVGFGDE